jgi:double-strand break repair protein MRE11
LVQPHERSSKPVHLLFLNSACQLTQRSHAYTETGYLPENFLPDFLDLVVWGHEHECLINPRLNPETNFHVMQPGSSVATSLVPGEAVPKHVSLLSIKGRDFTTENIRLKTVRPFIMREIILAEDKKACKIAKNSSERGRLDLTRHLMTIVEELISEAQAEWEEAQESRSQHSNPDDEDENLTPPLPLIRLRVETTAPPEGGTFDTENPQRFSNRFVGKVANTSDVVQFYKKKKSSTASTRKTTSDMPENTLLNEALDSVKVEKLVREFLSAQSLTILPQNSFGDAVSQFVDKDDKHAMEIFVNESLATQIKHLMALDHAAGGDEDDDEAQESLQAAMDKYRSQLEDMFSAGSLMRPRKRKLKPRPETWDSDLDGSWEDQPGALIHTDAEDNDDNSNEDDVVPPARAPATRGRGRGARATTTSARGRGAKTAATTTRKTATTKKPTSVSSSKATTSRSKKSTIPSDDDGEEEEEEEEELSDAMAVDSNDDAESDSQALFVGQTTARKATAAATRKPPARAAATKTKQSTLSFASQANQSKSARGKRVVDEISSDDDDEDAFEPVPKSQARSTGRGGRRR